MGNRDSDHPQTQLCFSGQWSLVELSLQACSGGLDLGGGWSRIQHSGGIRPGDVNSALPKMSTTNPIPMLETSKGPVATWAEGAVS